MIIALGHKKNTGKDTVADYLVSQWGYKRVSFAGKLRQVVTEAFDFDYESLTNPEFKEEVSEKYGISPRRAMQKVGQFFRREISHDFWIKRVEPRVQNLILQEENIVITDLRFINELNFVRKYDGKIVKINRSGVVNIDKDQSECELDCVTSWDYVIENNGDLQQLYDKVEDMLTAVGYTRPSEDINDEEP